MKFNQTDLIELIGQLPVWGIIICTLLSIFLFSFIISLLFRSPFILIDRFKITKARYIKKSKYTFNEWPGWITYAFMLWVSIPNAYRLFKMRNEGVEFWLLGLDLSDSVPYSLFFGNLDLNIPFEIALFLDCFAEFWYVPIVACFIIYLINSSKFYSEIGGIRYLLCQLFWVNVIYWICGFFYMFFVVPGFILYIILFVFSIFGSAQNTTTSEQQWQPQSQPQVNNESSNYKNPYEEKEDNLCYTLESQDMFNTQLRRVNGYSPDSILIHDSNQDSIYGNTYVDKDTGKEYRVVETDASGRPTKVEEKW